MIWTFFCSEATDVLKTDGSLKDSLGTAMCNTSTSSSHSRAKAALQWNERDKDFLGQYPLLDQLSCWDKLRQAFQCKTGLILMQVILEEEYLPFQSLPNFIPTT